MLPFTGSHLVKATKVNVGLAESNGRLVGIWRNSLHVTSGLTACTPGSAPGPTLGNEYGKTLPLIYNDDDRALYDLNADCTITSLLLCDTAYLSVS